MRRVIRPFVFWLLALALPLQGLAAATMLHCAPAADAAQHAAHEHDATMAHDAAGRAHAQPAATRADQPVTVALAASPAHAHADAHGAGVHDSDAQTAVHKCSACAACSVGLALPSASHTLPEPAVTPQAAPAPCRGHAAFFTSGPERPPRARA